jgi:transcription elongation factor Elf1
MTGVAKGGASMKNRKKLEKGNLGHLENWRGNNIAFNCPVCGKVQIVSGLLDKGGRLCDNCGKSKGVVDERGESASIEWDVDSSLIEKLN